MEFKILKDTAITDDERHFVETQCHSGNKAHQQSIASEIYASAVTRKSAQSMIGAAKEISASNAKYARWMGIMTAALVFAAIVQVGAALRSLGYEGYANDLNEVLIENSKRDLEVSKKKLSFDIINTLYTDFYKFVDFNSLVIRKLKAEQNIKDEFNLGLYLNGFEDLYEQCKRGLISREDIRMNFLHLIGTTCNNTQVERVINNAGNGLKLLCHSFYPNSQLGQKADTTNDACH